MLKIYEKAIDYLGIASIWEPSDPAPAVQIAECLMSMGRSNEACDLLGRIENEFGHLPKYEKILIKVKSILKIKKDFDQKK